MGMTWQGIKGRGRAMAEGNDGAGQGRYRQGRGGAGQDRAGAVQGPGRERAGLGRTGQGLGRGRVGQDRAGQRRSLSCISSYMFFLIYTFFRCPFLHGSFSSSVHYFFGVKFCLC